MADLKVKEDTDMDLSAECDVCGQNHVTEDCPMLGLSTSDFKAQISRARLTVPHYLGVIDYPDGEVGILAMEAISNKTQLGPFEAKKTCHCPPDHVFILKILSPDGNTICLDASSENHCNWMALVQVARSAEEQNCMAYQLGINIYFNTTRDIPAGTPLRVWYATKYAQKLGRPATPDGKTRSMLGMDISSWQSEDSPQTHPHPHPSSGEGLLEAAAYLSSVLPSTTAAAGDAMPAVLVKGDCSANGGQIYSCSKCSQAFFSQSDYAIHLRGHLMPTSLLSQTRSGKRGRPWGRVGVLTPMGRRGPGRPKKNAGPWKEPGEVLPRPSRPYKKRGRPRKVVVAQKPEPEVVVELKEEGETGEGTEAEGMADTRGLDSAELSADMGQAHSSSASTEEADMQVGNSATGPGGEGKERAEIKMEACDTPPPSVRSGDPEAVALGRSGDPEAVAGEDREEDGSRAHCPQATDPGQENPQATDPGQENPQAMDPGQENPQATDTGQQTPQDPSSATPVVEKVAKRRGRPRKSVMQKSGEGGSSGGPVKGGDPPPSLPSSLSSRRVQPRRTLKGKRTATFRYPGESTSDDDDDDDRTKGRNVLKQALKVKEYSDDDDEDEEDNRRRRGGLEPGEVVGEGVEITVQTAEGVILSKTPVILLDQDTGQAQALDPNTLSLVTTGVDSSGQQVVVLQSTPSSTTTATTTTLHAEEEDASTATTATTTTITTTPTTATIPCEGGEDGATTTTPTAPLHTGSSTAVSTSQSQTSESSDMAPDGLTTLVDAALSSHPMDKATEGATAFLKRRVGEEGEGGEEDMNSDDPDWRGPASGKREGPPRKRRPKRRKGDDPDLEMLEETIQVVDGPSGSKEYACGVCSKRFQQLKYLKMHLPAHTDKFLCSDCGRRFARHESLQKHVCEDWLVLVERIESDEDGSILYRCKECGRSFPQMEHARRHASMHRGTWACGKCQRTFPKRQLLLEHRCSQVSDAADSAGDDSNPMPGATGNDSGGEGAEAGEGGEFPCDICRQLFSNAKYLFRHMAMHTELFKCQTCGKCYSRKDSLQRHVLKCCPQLAEDYSVFACDKCKKTFGTRLGLENHELNCGKFQCSDCRIAFFSEEDLAQHKCEGRIIDDAAGVQFPCKECGKTFASLPYLARHEASHHAAFECQVCKKVFVRGEELSWHQPVCVGTSEIERDGLTTCQVCSTQFSDVRLFRDHFQVHTHPYRCDKCGKRFIKVGTLHTHKCDNVVAGTTGEEEGVWQCDVCEKTFKNERYLARHKQLHGLPSFDCEYCGKKFIRKDYLNDHKCVLPDGTPVRVVRKKNRLYIRDDLVCPHCHKTFSSRSNLNKHVRVHGEKEAECHICGKKFHYHSYLKLHVATVHDRQFQYQCSHCGKILFSKTGLIAHIKQFHQETVKLFPCPKCGKTFRQKGNMRTHLYSHTKERTFKCELCSKAFKYPDQLNRHRLEHTMSEKIKCTYCDKRFVRASELRQHERLFHSGVIYTCHVCHESCAHRHTIVRHYRRKHPELADIFDKQPDFLDTLQKPVDKATSLPAQQLPIQLAAPGVRVGEGVEQKPRIIRVLADGQEQEYIITTTTPLSATSHTPDTPAHDTPTPTADATATLQVGEQVLPYATLTTEQASDILPQEAVQVLQDMSGTVYETDASGMITQTVEDADGNQTVIILQVVNQDEMGAVQEVAHMDGDHMTVQEMGTDLGIEVPMEMSAGTVGGDSISYTTEGVMDSGAMESVIINAAHVDSAADGTITLVTSGLPTGIVEGTTMETAVMATSAVETETVDALEGPQVVTSVVGGDGSEHIVHYI